jgi:glycosyltransferase involved in cell wall biosynthesis
MSYRLQVLTSDRFPPTRVDITKLFGKQLVTLGFRCDWILQSEASCDQSYQAELYGGRAWIGRTDNGNTRLARLAKHAYAYTNILGAFIKTRKNAYDAIQAKDLFLGAITAIVVARYKRVPFLYWLSFPFPEASLYRAKQGIARYPVLYRIRGFAQGVMLYRLILPAARHVFVQSDQMKQDVMQKGVPASKLTPVPMGIDEEDIELAEDLSAADVPPGHGIVVYLGAMGRARQIDFVIRAFKRVLRHQPTALLYLVGAGNEPEDLDVLREEAGRLGIEGSVQFTGQLPRMEALRYVKAADVCLSPFVPTPILNSTSPTKLVEYMAFKKPVVANDHPEQRKVIAESGGGLCVPYSEDAFAQAISQLLADPKRARQMGEKGLDYVCQWRVYGQIAKSVAATFERILSNGVRK